MATPNGPTYYPVADFIEAGSAICDDCGSRVRTRTLESLPPHNCTERARVRRAREASPDTEERDMAFNVGDLVWINDGYSGSPYAAVVDNVAEDGRLYASSARPITGDSRYVEWTIQPDRVGDMVTPRDAEEV